jgi:hypothetical protein
LLPTLSSTPVEQVCAVLGGICSTGAASMAFEATVYRYKRGSLLLVGEQDGLLLRILRGTADANIPFDGLCQLLRRLGFAERIRGSHHIFTKAGVEEILNLQPKGRQAKPYQVKQVRRVILTYRLGGSADVSCHSL